MCYSAAYAHAQTHTARHALVVYQRQPAPATKQLRRSLCPLTSAPLGHDDERRGAEQRRLTPSDPASAPPGRGRHPAGDGPDCVNHDAEMRDFVRRGDMVVDILHPRCIRSFLLPLPASLVKTCDVTARFLKGHRFTRTSTHPGNFTFSAPADTQIISFSNAEFP